MKSCPACGAENRDTANFCRICQESLHGVKPASASTSGVTPPGAAPPQPVQAPGPILPANPTVLGSPPVRQPPVLPAPPVVIQPVQPRRRWGRWSLRSAPLVEGRVAVVDPLREARLPLDPGRGLVTLGLALLGLGACSLIGALAVALFIALAILGLGSLCMLPLVMPLVTSLLAWLFFGGRGNRTNPLVDFVVEDQSGGAPASVILYMKDGSSTLRMGDLVRVYGRRPGGSGAIRAYRVDVYETKGRPVEFSVRGVRPWPLWLGFLILGGVVAFYVWLFMGGYLPQF